MFWTLEMDIFFVISSILQHLWMFRSHPYNSHYLVFSRRSLCTSSFRRLYHIHILKARTKWHVPYLFYVGIVIGAFRNVFIISKKVRNAVSQHVPLFHLFQRCFVETWPCNILQPFESCLESQKVSRNQPRTLTLLSEIFKWKFLSFTFLLCEK